MEEALLLYPIRSVEFWLVREVGAVTTTTISATQQTVILHRLERQGVAGSVDPEMGLASEVMQPRTLVQAAAVEPPGGLAPHQPTTDLVAETDPMVW